MYILIQHAIEICWEGHWMFMFLLLTHTWLQIHRFVVCKRRHLKSKQEVEICETRCEACSMILESDLEAYQMVRCVSIRLTSGWLVLGALWIFRHLTGIAYKFRRLHVYRVFTASHRSLKHPFEDGNHLRNLHKPVTVQLHYPVMVWFPHYQVYVIPS